jgi:hypothetical protein
VQSIRCVWAALSFLALASGPVAAQESLDAKVQRHEQTIKTLEARVAALEAQLRGRSAPVSVPKGKENWRKLHTGMKQAEVEQLFGSPTKVDSFGVLVVWRYGGLDGGEVQFDDSGRVTGWHEP